MAALTVHMHTPPPTAASSWLRSASLLAARCMAQSGCVDQVSSALTAAVQAFAVASNTDQEPPLDARTLHALATAAAHAAGHPAAAHALFRQVAACVDVSAAVSDMRLAPLALALPALALKAAADPTTPIAPPLPTLATALLQAAKHVARGSAVGCLAAAGGGLLAVQGVCGGPPTRAALLQGVQLLLDVMGTGRGGSGGAVLGLAAVLGGPGALPGVPGVGWGVLEQGPAVKSALQVERICMGVSAVACTECVYLWGKGGGLGRKQQVRSPPHRVGLTATARHGDRPRRPLTHAGRLGSITAV